MKKIQILTLLFFSLDSFSQTVTLDGTAIDATKGLNPVWITINEPASENYIITDSVGRFRIKAKLIDSLYFSGFNHFSKTYLVADLLKMKAINIILEPIPCETYIECKDTTPAYFVFIGEKIKLQSVEEKNYCNMSIIDRKFKAEYKIIESLYGAYPKDTIHFVAYDHYGFPPFGEYQNVMLFVSQYCGENFHVKYQYFPVYKTIDNRWAAPYPIFEYSKLDSSLKIKPEKIQFQEPLVFDLTPSSSPGSIRRRKQISYPEPFYKTENGKVTAIYGNYAPELFELKRKTVLKSSGINFQ